MTIKTAKASSCNKDTQAQVLNSSYYDHADKDGLAQSDMASQDSSAIDIARAVESYDDVTQEYGSSVSSEELAQAETAAELARLREEIDAADEAIAALLRVRTSLVRSAARLKSESGEGVVSGIREQKILFHGAQLEKKYGLAPSLMQDLQRRILRQSYTEKGSGEFASAHLHGPASSSAADKCKVCVVGGAGGMGSFFVRYLNAAGYKVSIVEVHDYHMDSMGNEVKSIAQSVAAQRLAEANWCIVSVPIDKTTSVIKQVASLIKSDCILSDLTSVKSEPVQAMLNAHNGPVIGLHPMFGPDTVSFVKQVVVLVNGRHEDKCAFIAEQMRLFGAHVVSCSASEHDSAMRVIQALRHFTTIAYGNFLRERFGAQDAPAPEIYTTSVCTTEPSKPSLAVTGNCEQGKVYVDDAQAASDSPFIARLMDISSPIYHLELLMVGRLFAQSPELYCDIISASDKNLALIEQYIDCAGRCLKRLKDNDRDGFIDEFKSTTAFFGSYANSFLKESGRILALVQDTFEADK